MAIVALVPQFVNQFLSIEQCLQYCSFYHNWNCKQGENKFDCFALFRLSNDYEVKVANFSDIQQCFKYCPTTNHQYCHQLFDDKSFSCYVKRGVSRETQIANPVISEYKQKLLADFETQIQCDILCSKISYFNRCVPYKSSKFKCTFQSFLTPLIIHNHQLFTEKEGCFDYCTQFYHWRCSVLSASLYFCNSYEQLRVGYKALQGFQFASNLSQCQWVCKAIGGQCTYESSQQDYVCYYHIEDKNLVRGFQFVRDCHDFCGTINGSCIYYRFSFGDLRFFCNAPPEYRYQESYLYDYDEEENFPVEQQNILMKQRILSMLFGRQIFGGYRGYAENSTISINGITFNQQEIMQTENNGPQ